MEKFIGATVTCKTYPSNYGTGEIIRIDSLNSTNPTCVIEWQNGVSTNLPLSYLTVLSLREDLNNQPKNMESSLKGKVAEHFMQEPQKTFVRLGLLDSQRGATAAGIAAYVTFMLNGEGATGFKDFLDTVTKEENKTE